jgi:putative transcriptional regulator
MKSNSSKKAPVQWPLRLGAAAALGREIRRQRQSRGLSQDGLAELARTTQASIAHLESGRYNPTLELIERVAGAMKMDLVVALRRRLGD